MRSLKYIYIISVLTVLAIVGCGRGSGDKGLTHDEVVAINERVLEKAIGQPDSALMMIERLRAGDFSVIDTTGASLQWSGLLPDYHCDYLRAKVYSQTLEGMWLDSAIIIGERLMTTDAARENLAYSQNVLEMLINACRQHRDDELTIHWCTELIGLYRQNGDETEALRTEADLGLMLSGIGHAAEGLAKIDSVLNLLSGKRQFNELDATIIALKRKVNVLKNMERYGDVPAAAQQMLDLMADYEQHPDVYHDGTYREPPEHLRPVYIDFYRAQAYMYMAEAYASLSEKGIVNSEKFATAIPSGEGTAAANSSLFTHHSSLRKAKEYLSLFEQTNYSKSFSARKDFAPTYGLLGEYDKMLAIHDEQEARLREQGDTVSAEYATILRDRAIAAEAQGRYAEANRLHNAYETLTATLNDRLLQGKANLYAARFHAAEQQREIERHKAKLKYLGIVGGCIGIAAVLATLFAAYVIHKRRIVDQKNRALVKQIAEVDKLREQKASPSPSQGGGVKIDDTMEAPAASANQTPPPLEGLGEASLFQHIQQVIKDERLYLDPQFDRQAACDYFQISAHDVGAAFAQGSEHASITDFINMLRLDHARLLLTDHPEMSIDKVALSSGFSLRRTFSRLFKDKFGLTPTEYRTVYLSTQEHSLTTDED